MTQIFCCESSKHEGVSWDKTSKRWRVNLKYNKKQYHFGRYPSEEEAGRVAAEARAAREEGTQQLEAFHERITQERAINKVC